MANTILNIQLPSGLSGLLVTLYPDGSDTQGNTPDVLTEASNRLGLYSATITEALSGKHYVKVMDGSSLLASGWVELQDDTNTYHVQDDYPQTTTGGGAGTGARTVTITVDDGTNPLENALVRLTEGASTFTRYTNASGQATFNVDDATYTVAITKAGHQYNGTSLAVSSDTSVTYSMTANVTQLSSGALATGYAYIYGTAGVLANETVTITPKHPRKLDGLGVKATAVTDTSDANGYVEFTNLVRGVSYTISYGAFSKVFEVPAQATFELPSFVG